MPEPNTKHVLTESQIEGMLSKQFEKAKTGYDKALADKDTEHIAAMKTQAEEHEKKLAEFKDQKGVIPPTEKDKTFGFKEPWEFYMATVKWARGTLKDPRLIAMLAAMEEENATLRAAGTPALETGQDDEGGFLVPIEHRPGLLQHALELANFTSKMTEVPMARNTLTIPTIDDTTHAGGAVHGGIIVYRTAEEAATTATKPKFGKVQLHLNKLMAVYYASEELLEDSPISLEPLLAESFAQAFSWKSDNEAIWGTGAGEPLGVMSAAAKVSITAETAQTGDDATTIVWENIIKMWARMPASSKRNAIWCINPDCIPALYSMGISIGTAGTLAFMPGNQPAVGNAPQTLFSRPIIETEHCQTIGTTGDIILWDPTQFLHGVKAGRDLKFSSSVHVKFLEDQMTFKITYRNDHQPWWDSPLTPRYSSSTMAPIIVLGTRS